MICRRMTWPCLVLQADGGDDGQAQPRAGRQVGPRRAEDVGRVARAAQAGLHHCNVYLAGSQA